MTNILEEMVMVWCEWDIGQDSLVFSNPALAYEWAEEALKDGGFEESFQDMLDLGLVGLNYLKVVW